jgi:hypothetical protein
MPAQNALQVGPLLLAAGLGAAFSTVVATDVRAAHSSHPAHLRSSQSSNWPGNLWKLIKHQFLQVPPCSAPLATAALEAWIIAASVASSVGVAASGTPQKPHSVQSASSQMQLLCVPTLHSSWVRPLGS